MRIEYLVDRELDDISGGATLSEYGIFANMLTNSDPIAIEKLEESFPLLD